MGEFENNRVSTAYSPINGASIFFDASDGKFAMNASYNDGIEYYDIILTSGIINTGELETFIIDGIVDRSVAESVYNNININNGATLIVDKKLRLSNSTINIVGNIQIEDNCAISVINGSTLVISSTSHVHMSYGSMFMIDDCSKIYIYGSVDVYMGDVEYLDSNPNIIIDPSAAIIPYEIPIEGKEYSLIDYFNDLRYLEINAYTQGDKNTNIGQIGYVWRNGVIIDKSQALDLTVFYGDAILGDLRLSILGIPNKMGSGISIVSNINIEADATMYISTIYNGIEYTRPELYMGIISDRAATLNIYGTLIIDGIGAKLFTDDNSSITINDGATLICKNGGIIFNRQNDYECIKLIINGTLIIDSMDNLLGFHKDYISVSKAGKIIILNKFDEDTMLFSTPNGIHNSELYNVFGHVLDNTEYHINDNNIICIDKFYDFYNNDMIEWYNGIRIENAIFKGQIIWHDGACIELNSEIIPWVNKDCGLLESSRIFKSFESYDHDKLQDVVNRLTYAGCGNIKFRFVYGDESHEVTLRLSNISLDNITCDVYSNIYTVDTTNADMMFLQNKTTMNNADGLIRVDSTIILSDDGIFTFGL